MPPRLRFSRPRNAQRSSGCMRRQNDSASGSIWLNIDLASASTSTLPTRCRGSSPAYPPLAQIANRWLAALKQPETFPSTLARFLSLCREHDQVKPTPLLLYYEQGGYNCLHQDLYGPIAFPLQMTVCLSCPQTDYTGGEFLLVEQRPRAQSRGIALTLQQGQGIIFATRYRPVRGTRGYHRLTVRHGLSTVTSGQRYTLGIIFHNAQ